MRDAGPVLDAGPVRDAGRDAGPVSCPVSGAIGFDLMAAGRLPLPRRMLPREIALAGDGERLFLAVGSADRSVPSLLFELSAALEPIDELAFANGHSLEMSVDDGVVRLAALADDGPESLMVYEGERVSTARFRHTHTEGAPFVRLAAPAWNGRDVVIAGEDSAGGVFIGALRDEAPMETWRAVGPAAFVALDTDPATREVHALRRESVDTALVERFDRDGGALTPPGGVVLSGVDEFFVGRVAFGFSDDDALGDWVLAGWSLSLDGEERVVLRRFFDDGGGGAGFSSPFDFTPERSIALTTTPPTGHRSGYGLAASDGRRVLFHGAGEGFVGGARDAPITCDGPDGVVIASGPCGYLIACLDGRSVAFAWAVPQRPRR